MIRRTMLIAAAAWFVLVAAAPTIRQANAAPATQPSPEAAAPLVEKGMAALTAGDHKVARDAFAAAVAAEPKNVRAQHGLGLSLYHLGESAKARDALEKAFLASGAAPDRAIVINLSLVHYKLNNTTRAMKIVKEATARPAKEPDEQLLNALAVLINSADDAMRKNSLYGQSVTAYTAYTTKVEAKRPGMKRWGVEWLSEDEVDEKVSRNEQAEKKLGRLTKDLAAANRRVDDAQKNLAKQEDLRRRGFVREWVVSDARRELREVERERDQVASEHEATKAQIAKPKFPADWQLVSIDAVNPPAVGETVVEETDPMSRFDEKDRFKEDDTDDAAAGDASNDSSEDEPAPAAPPPPANRTRRQPPQTTPQRRGGGTGRTDPTRGNEKTPEPQQRMNYCAAFPVAPNLLVTAAAPLEGASDLNVQAHDGTPLKAEIVRADGRSGLALLRITGPSMAYLDLAGSFTGGAVECVTFPDENFFEPAAAKIKGTTPRVGDGWKIKLDKHPRVAGGPLLVNGKVVGVAVADDPDADIDHLPAATLDQLRKFVGADLPKKPGDNPDPLTVMLQVTITR